VNDPDARHDHALERAEVLCDLGRFADAERQLGEAVAQQPHDPEGWCLLARAQLGSTNYERALRSADTAAGLDPDGDWAHRLRSIALQNMDQADLAVAAASTAVRANPHAWETHHCLAQALISAERRPKEAIDAAARAVALAPNEPDAHFSMGAAAAAAGRRDQARDAFQRALSLDPQHFEAHHELARLHLKRRLPTGPTNLAAAASGFATALRVDPAASLARLNLDLVLRSFLARASYLIFLAAALPAHFRLNSTSLPDRALPVALLTVPAYFAARFVRRLSPQLRGHLQGLITSRRFVYAAAAEFLGATALVASSIAPSEARRSLALLAVAAALTGRLLLEHEAHELTQRALNKPPTPWISNSLLWVLVVALLIVATTAFLAAPTSGSVAACVAIGGICLAAAAIILRAIKRRAVRGRHTEPL
jgi:tetratricopeptide (TPR) repeat protein